MVIKIHNRSEQYLAVKDDGGRFLFDVEFSYSATDRHKRLATAVITAMVAAYNAETANIVRLDEITSDDITRSIRGSWS